MTELSFERRDDVLIARISGEIDIASADHLEDAILGEVRGTDAGGVVVDLSDVSFLDSAGIRLLFAVHRSITEDGRPVAIAVPDASRIAAVLGIVEMASVVWTAPTLDGAIEMLFPPDVDVQPSPLPSS